MPVLVGYLLLFVALAVFFVFIHLMIGRLVRPIKPDPEKLTIYECGEPTVGSSWIQFDLRFYVVALLFVIFDVEVAFFFPWALVFNQATELGRADLPEAERAALVAQLPAGEKPPEDIGRQLRGARRFGWLAFADVLVFFGVLLVGYAYLWKRGDLDWVRSVAAEEAPAVAQQPVEQRQLVGTGSGV